MPRSFRTPAGKRVIHNKFYSTAEVVEILGVTRQTVDKYRNQGLLPGSVQYHERGRWLHPGKSVLALLRSRL